MSDRNFRTLLESRWTEGRFVCVGLDSDYKKIPAHVRSNIGVMEAMVDFNMAIVEATCDHVCAYKPNIAFYERQGIAGLSALGETIKRIKRSAPDVPVILDAKRGDIDNTNAGYVYSAFELLGADAVTVHPYLGGEALQPFLKQKDKGIIVLCRTSNKGAGEFQDLSVPNRDCPAQQMMGAPQISRLIPLYQEVAKRVARDWNANGNCAIVVGATYPEELAEVRTIVGDMPILIPGIGAQGGDVEKTVKAGRDSRGCGMIINSSRGIIFASSGEDFAEAARRETIRLHEEINRYRV